MAETREIRVPDIGDVDDVTVVEILVAVGDSVEQDDSLITLESDKASMEVPSTVAGTVKELKVSEGDEINEGAVILVLEVESSDDGAAGDAPADDGDKNESGEAEADAEDSVAEDTETEDTDDPKDDDKSEPIGEPASADQPDTKAADPANVDQASFDAAHASPSTRKLARQLSIDLGSVKGTGRKGRITDDDLKSHIKGAMASGSGSSTGGVSDFEWPAMPDIDFSKFGPVEEQPLGRIRKVSKRNLHRSWLHVPHVTQHEDADVTELEAFRKAHSEEAKQSGYKLTPLAFMLKAAAAALKQFPDVNSSLSTDGESLIVKGYINIGVAVDTDGGLVVPVIRDVDKKGIYQLAEEVVEASIKARDGKLTPKDFQGGCFTISSLGGIGGTAFTPIVNAPEVAILGVSRHRWQPVYQDGEFVPRLMMPLSFSYDHRVIDGAMACRFTVYLAKLLGDIRRLLL